MRIDNPNSDVCSVFEIGLNRSTTQLNSLKIKARNTK